MSQITRTWLAFAALGTGLIHLALVVGLPLPLGILLGALGAAEFAWAIVTLARDDLVAPRIARVVALVPVLGWSVIVVTATIFDVSGLASALPVLPMAVATLFELVAVAILSSALRPAERVAEHTTDTREAPSAPALALATPSVSTTHPVRYLVALTAGAVVVGALTTPALAATEAGRYAQPHGSHDGSAVTPNDVEDAVSIDDLVRPGHDGSHE
ncbi:hypothetical protein [Marisediminicola sp. LYQ85]|uniref:hypothetical protein n=1 Tax=Marisediminicola sp. LYQ85 TaxID=3391062 RepID=UPI00398398EF